MTIVLQLPSDQEVTLDSSSAVIGRDSGCQVVLNDNRVQPIHATIKKVANRWLIQSEGEWLLRVGNGVPGGKCWLTTGDRIFLSESGPSVVFLHTDIKTASTRTPAAVSLGADGPPPVPSSVEETTFPPARAVSDQVAATTSLVNITPSVTSAISSGSASTKTLHKGPPPVPFFPDDTPQPTPVNSAPKGPPPVPDQDYFPQSSDALAFQPSLAPVIWNPKWLGAWSLILTWGFGAFLLAKNWMVLGEPTKARRAMFWFYSIFPWLIIAAFTPDTATVTKVMGTLGLGILVVFYQVEVKPQIQMLKERFNDNFVRRSWGKPIAVAIGCLVACVAVVVVLVEDSDVRLVKEGHLSAYPNVSIGKAVDAFLSNPRWESLKGTDGNEYVNVRGGATLHNKPVQLLMQFRINRKANSFEINALEANDVPLNGLMLLGLLNKIFQDYNKQ